MRTVERRRRAAAFSAAVVLLLTAPVAAQRESRSQMSPDRREELQRSGTAASVVQPRSAALESTIDPKEYVVGPSDLIAVNIWSTPPTNLVLSVTPEGTLIIPAVGEVRVADMTLAEAKERVLAQIRGKYLSGSPTVTLVSPREVVVTVQGEVLNPGSYRLPAHGRVDRALDAANELLPGQSAEQQQYIQSRISERHVFVRHKDGSQSSADIAKFRGTKQGRWNPYLREGDIIVAPQRNILRGGIGIYGEVNDPSRYEFTEGDSASHLLKMGFGFTPRAILDSVSLTRLSEDGRTMEQQTFNAMDLLAGRSPDIALRPGDRIVVPSRAEERGDFRASVWGEVLSPGFYPITRDRTKVSDLVRMAGGLTEFAEPASGQLIRRSTEPQALSLERLESLRGGVSPDDSTYYYLETELRLQKEIVNMDFEAVFVRNDTSADIVLRDGDAVVFQDVRRTVYVFGQVASPGHVPFVEGQRAEYYLAQAGGLTDRAREGDIKVVKAKNKQWLSPDETQIERGDYLWVPKEYDRPFGYYLAIVAQSAAVISVAISLYLLVRQ